MTYKQAVRISGLNEAQIQAIHRAAMATWDAIGYDCLCATVQSNPRKTTMSKAEVIEVVYDANRLEQFGAAHLQDQQVLAFVRNNDPWTKERSEAVHAILKKAFPYARYGM